jgi:hypothetical protein
MRLINNTNEKVRLAGKYGEHNKNVYKDMNFSSQILQKWAVSISDSIWVWINAEAITAVYENIIQYR